MKSLRLSDRVPLDVTFSGVLGPINNQMVFLTSDARELRVSVEMGSDLERQMTAIGASFGDRLLIFRERSYAGGEARQTLRVFKARVPIGEQRDGSFVVPSQPGAEPIEARILPGRYGLSDLQKAFALSNRLSQDPDVPAAQRNQFRAIEHLIWRSCGR